MKRIVFLAALMAFAFAAPAQQTADDVIKVKTEVYDFGKIKQNVPVEYAFEITNISNKPVVVENSWATCGCTVPEKITEPIMPGATAKLKVSYNAASLGHFSKDAYIKLAGIDQPKTLKVTGEVLSPEAWEAYVKEKGKTKDSKNN
jgi:hypothetical protein